MLLAADGWSIIGRRVRTPRGELDLVAERGGLVAFVEVKLRRSLDDAAQALSARQQRRIAAAAECWLAANPSAGATGIRFDVVLVDRNRNARRIPDAFRPC
ncbi:MAG: YraN family protein [Elioraea sp.]|nr:YraN family protein [Elioraea sp.]MDW8397438.1 YraN family protein [Acetobacteraceae bacterium]